MICVWWNFEGVMYVELVLNGKSIKSELCYQQKRWFENIGLYHNEEAGLLYRISRCGRFTMVFNSSNEVEFNLLNLINIYLEIRPGN
ncbi:hypothetical protein KIN20_019957 [Parelaphostrongylus tenuis]|uniref:Uncharacterized protein n=1 Tax=Parelaphostrongylus tenuis TaxID=148309 RepID=A0AAD5MQF2_PARTN|nr:hypothetical protein KIN20_019957 [Parelaphostrongylus tenuis]